MDQLTRFQAQNTVATRRKRMIVRHKDRCKTKLLVQLFDEGEDRKTCFLIEIAGRLVGEQQRGACNQRAGDDHPLAFTTGKLAGTMMGSGRETHAAQCGDCLWLCILCMYAANQKRHHDVF